MRSGWPRARSLKREALATFLVNMILFLLFLYKTLSGFNIQYSEVIREMFHANLLFPL